mmetsp:Transcript_38072/g.89125  ORF Transcript_38072/g.89125 Transcript_38072/m.89125 type:complete len:243 (-) Transcript_38072:1430-2158(-)
MRELAGDCLSLLDWLLREGAGKGTHSFSNARPQFVAESRASRETPWSSTSLLDSASGSGKHSIPVSNRLASVAVAPFLLLPLVCASASLSWRDVAACNKSELVDLTLPLDAASGSLNARSSTGDFADVMFFFAPWPLFRKASEARVRRLGCPVQSTNGVEFDVSFISLNVLAHERQFQNSSSICAQSVMPGGISKEGFRPMLLNPGDHKLSSSPMCADRGPGEAVGIGTSMLTLGIRRIGGE